MAPNAPSVSSLEAFRTLHVRLRNLPDAVALYPTHGAGSFCAAGSGDVYTSTIGRERMTNAFLQTTGAGNVVLTGTTTAAGDTVQINSIGGATTFIANPPQSCVDLGIGQ